MKEPITFSPNLQTADPLLNYWIRQVTLRLRREICWCWHERGLSPDSNSGTLPPPIDPLSASLEMSRYWDVKLQFFQEDQTAKYLSDQLKGEVPGRGDCHRGTLGWAIEELKLDDTATFVLALGLAIAFDSAMGSVIAACLNDSSQTRPNLALAQKLWERPEQVLGLADPAHPLFSYGLLQQVSHSSQPASVIDWEAPITVPTPVVNQLLFPDLPLPRALAPLNSKSEGEVVLVDEARFLAARLQGEDADALRLVPILGPRGSAHLEIACGIALATNRDAVAFQGEPALLEDSYYLNALAALCWLRGVALFLEPQLVFSLQAARQRSGEHWLPRQSIPLTIYLGVTERSQLEGIPDALLLPIIETRPLSYHQRIAHWQKALGESAQGLDSVISEYSRRFRYEKETIDDIAEGLKGLPQPILGDDFARACRAELEQDIGELAQKVTPRFEDEDLILPHKQDLQFREIRKAMESLTKVHYEWGTAKAWNESGISVLFAGPPGTGKTMAAEILAIQLDLPMYRIDLSQVVNKYIGETEKNLKRLFDAADVSDTILFFDEADALFGKRTEVKDAHDRYANLEISYLLERMERFKGLAILATNRKSDLDEAFLRRLRYIIDFPLPEEEERQRIWRQVIPQTVYNPFLFGVELEDYRLLNESKIPDDLPQAFANHKVAFPKNAKVFVNEEDQEWLIVDEKEKIGNEVEDGSQGTYLLQREGNQVRVYYESTIDFDFLAEQFPLAGGHIRSIVFNSCLQSANKSRLTMKQVIIAVKREYDKLNRTVSLEHFGPYANIVQEIESQNGKSED
jgi:hypothetical protein